MCLSAHQIERADAYLPNRSSKVASVRKYDDPCVTSFTTNCAGSVEVICVEGEGGGIDK
jgi:hypothetical protein